MSKVKGFSPLFCLFSCTQRVTLAGVRDAQSVTESTSNIDPRAAGVPRKIKPHRVFGCRKRLGFCSWRLCFLKSGCLAQELVRNEMKLIKTTVKNPFRLAGVSG